MIKQQLMFGAAVVALWGAGPAALAQTLDETAATSADEIVVTGFRSQIRSSLGAKQQADGVADFLIADDIGRFPDQNLADSLRRLPGVVTEFDEDEGRFVSVRGMPSRYTFVALNGAYIPDGWFASSRQQDIEAVPPYAVKRVGVYKSLSADLDGNAIGGYVNNTLRSAFDHDGFKLTGQASLGLHTNTDTPGGPGNPSPKIRLRVSDTFGANDQFGIFLAGEFFDKNRDQTKSLRQIKYESDDTPYVYRIEALDYTNKLRRWSALGRLEWKPTDNFYTAVSGSHFDYQYDEYRYFTRIDGRGARTTGADGGSFTQGRAEILLDRYPISTETDFAMWDMDWRPSETSHVTSNFTWAEGRYTLPVDENSINFRTGDLDALGYSYDFTGQDESSRTLAPIAFNDASALLNLSQYDFIGDFWPRVDKAKQKVVQGRIDYEYKPIDNGVGIKTGAQWRNLKASQDLTRDQFYSLAPGTSLSPEPFAYDATLYNPGLGAAVPFINPNAVTDYWRANPDAFVLDRRDSVVPGGIESLRSDYDYNEDVYAGYGLLGYESENLKIKAGARVEHTAFDTTAYRRDNTDALTLVTNKGDYTDILPSVVASYGIAEDVILRVGYNKAIGRPDPGDIARGETESDNGAGEIKISRGNPDLKPRKADNYDIALEYYFGDGALFSVGYFYKTLKNEIFTAVEDDYADSVHYIYTQPVNATSGKVQGVEITLADDKFDFLPGFLADFGFMSNFTYLDGRLDAQMSDGSIRRIEQMPGAAKYRVNASLLYERGPFEGQVTYAYTGDRRVNINTGNALQDQFEKAYNQLDFQLRYRLTDNLQAFVEGRNVTNEIRLIAEGYDASVFRERNDFGGSYWIGINFDF